MHAVVVAAGEAAATELSIPPAATGLLAFGVLVTLLMVAYAFRSMGQRN